MFGPMALTVVFALAGVAGLRADPDAGAGEPCFLKRCPRRSRCSSGWAKRVYAPLLDARSDAGRKTVGDGAARALRGSLVLMVPSWAPSSSRASTRAPSRCRSGGCRASRWSSPTRSAPWPSGLGEGVPQEVDTVVSRTGRAEIATDPMGVEISDTFIMLNPPESGASTARRRLVAAIDEALKKGCPAPSSATPSPSSCGWPS
jgi:cobalt-zinc-cadmium resistance protein CzcA